MSNIGETNLELHLQKMNAEAKRKKWLRSVCRTSSGSESSQSSESESLPSGSSHDIFNQEGSDTDSEEVVQKSHTSSHITKSRRIILILIVKSIIFT